MNILIVVFRTVLSSIRSRARIVSFTYIVLSISSFLSSFFIRNISGIYKNAVIGVIDWMFEHDNSLDLKKCLARLPELYDFNFDADFQQVLYRLFYFSLSKEGKYLSLMFPKASKSSFPTSWADILSEVNKTQNISCSNSDRTHEQFWFDSQQSKPTVISHKGRVCNAKFHEGDLIYKCR